MLCVHFSFSLNFSAQKSNQTAFCLQGPKKENQLFIQLLSLGTLGSDNMESFKHFFILKVYLSPFRDFIANHNKVVIETFNC